VKEMTFLIRNLDQSVEKPEAQDFDPRPIWEIAADLGAAIPEEDRAKVPHDSSVNYKHYLYGTPEQTK
jgi:hypothetical protein